jgi:hypothetical protein
VATVVVNVSGARMGVSGGKSLASASLSVFVKGGSVNRETIEDNCEVGGFGDGCSTDDKVLKADSSFSTGAEARSFWDWLILKKNLIGPFCKTNKNIHM